MSSDASTIVVGVNLIEGIGPGYVKIFTMNPDVIGWYETERIDGVNPDSALGTTVALSPDGVYLAVCAPFEAGNGGRVYIYTRVGDTYNLVTMLEQGSGYAPDTQFGKALAIVHNNISGIVTVAVASPLYLNGTGRTWVFTDETGSYVEQVLSYTGISTSSDSQYGGSVCISGDGRTVYTSAIGSGELQTYKFELSYPNTWTQTGVILPGVGFEVPDPGNYSFGVSSSVSADNTVLAIGALNQAVYVYDCSGKGQYSTSTAKEYGPGRTPVIPGESFATKTVLSGDGKTMAVISSLKCSVYITSLI